MTRHRQRLEALELQRPDPNRLNAAARRIATNLAASLAAMDVACGLPARDYSVDAEKFVEGARAQLQESLAAHGEAQRWAQRELAK